MANNEIKTNAEIYREQRKARLAKAAKKKKSGKGDKVLSIFIKIVCIVTVVALALYFVAQILTSVLCVPQKVLTAATYNGEKLTVAEYNYYYNSLYNQAVSYSQYYDQQQSGMGAQYFDTTVDPADQEYTGDNADENVVTWADYFRYHAPEQGFIVKELYKRATSDEAKNAGFALTEEQTTEMNTAIDEHMATLAENAKTADFSLTNYIAKTCGEGLNEETYRELLERDYYAQYYLEWYQESLQDEISSEDVNVYYNAHKADYDIATLRFFTVSYAAAEDGSTDPVYTKEEAKARADQFVAKATDEAAFTAAALEFAPPSLADSYKEDSATLASNLTKSSLSQLTEELTDWSFDNARKTGDIKVFDVADYEAYYIIMVVSPAAKDTASAGADVRHILCQAETTKTDAEGNQTALPQAEIDANLAAAKTEADKLLAEWKAGEATEESFAALATQHTDDTGSAETGGLYEDITSSSQYVAEFRDWALAPHTKGDTEIVKTTYGYHIMYFVGAEAEQKWETDVRAAIASTTFEEFSNGIYDSIGESVELNDQIIKFFANRLEKTISKNIANSLSTAY
ncbi:MAG: peptidylprolyl isomerase [Clostridia bacterium]|nr:peptidylprolyl isomerase [Clostridia bacterium]